jgi:hypothetical protein
MAERLSALADTYQRGDLGAARGDGQGIIIAERRPLAMVQVAALSGAAVAVRAFGWGRIVGSLSNPNGRGASSARA